jgi:hypothetical protein
MNGKTEAAIEAAIASAIADEIQQKAKPRWENFGELQRRLAGAERVTEATPALPAATWRNGQ